MWSTRRVAVGIILAACTDCGSAAPPAASGSGGATGAGGEGGSAGSTSSGSTALAGPITSAASSSTTTTSTGVDPTPCPDGKPEALPAGVPPCWRRLPDVANDCDLFYAPSPDTMSPAAPWAPCGEGCLELVNDWSTDPRVRFFAPRGWAADGAKYIAYKRTLVLGKQNETHLIRLPENRVEMALIDNDAIWGRCVGGISAGTGKAALVEFSYQGGEPNDIQNYSQYVQILSFGNPVPWTSYKGPMDSGFLDQSMSDSLWVNMHQGAMRLTWHGLPFSPELKPLYSEPGKVVFAPVAHKSDVFFSTWGDPSEILAWDPVGGARKLVPFQSLKEGGACCLGTDGKTMTWLQGSDYKSGHFYETMNVMVSPYATSAAQLQPKVLRPAFQNSIEDGKSLVSGKYGAALEGFFGSYETRLIVTRLSDGAYWVIPTRPSMQWAEVLYLDHEELALVEKPAEGVDLVRPGYYWTIVRLKLASLGTPKMPGEGF